MDSIKKLILATAAYYDVLDYPLTAEEIFNFLVKYPRSLSRLPGPTPGAGMGCLAGLVKEEMLGMDGGFYFLPNREYLVPLRLKKKQIWQYKIKKARKAARWLRFVPFVRAVLASGSLAQGNTDELSDLDVLIVAQRGRIWTTRFFIIALTSILGIRRRPHERISPDRICLNHYITNGSLRINLKSIYNAQTYISLKPLILIDKTVPAKFREENDWVLQYVQNWPKWDRAHLVTDGFLTKVCRKTSELVLGKGIGDVFEKTVRRWQIKKIEKNPLTSLPGSKVVYDDNRLEFHPESPERYILEKYESKILDLGLR